MSNLTDLQREFATAHRLAEAARAALVEANERYRRCGGREGDARKALHAFVEKQAMLLVQESA